MVDGTAIDQGVVVDGSLVVALATASGAGAGRCEAAPAYSRPATARVAVVAAAPSTVVHRIVVESASIGAMVLEVAVFEVLPDTAEKFESAFHEVKHAVLASPGLLSLRMTRGVESPNRFVLLIEWESVEAHVKNFRETERYAIWRGGLSPFFASAPQVEHYADVEEAIS